MGKITFDRPNPAVPVSITDRLRLTVWNRMNSSVRISVDVRFIDLEGKEQRLSHELAPGSGGSAKTSTFSMPNGYIISVTAYAFGTDFDNGLVYIQAGLQQGSIFANRLTYLFFAAYITPVTPLAWPSAAVQPTQSGPGSLGLDSPSDPGLGNNLNYSVLTNGVIHITGIQFDFTTSSTTASRRVRIRIDVGGTEALRFTAAFTQAASNSWHYQFSAAVENSVNDMNAQVPIPPNLTVDSDSTINTSIKNMKSGDRISSIHIYRNFLFTIT